MQSLLDLHLLVDKYSALLPKLNLEEQEKYSTMLLWLQNQVEGETPRQSYVDQCLAWLERATMPTPQPLPRQRCLISPM